MRVIPFFDPSRVHIPMMSDLTDAFRRVLVDGRFINGPDVAALEAEFAAVCGADFAVGVSSGTDALLAALMALEIGPGDEVLVPTLTFFATAGAVARLGGTPVFVDVDPDTLLMDVPQALSLITARTRAVIPVHLFGQLVDLQPFIDAGLTVLEDCAQSHGARTASGLRCGTIGALGTFSFFPTKPLGGFGDGGMVITSDARLADQVRLVSNHGARPKFHHLMVGANFRLDTLQAALLRLKLPYLDEWAAARQRLAAVYRERLAALHAAGQLRLLVEGPGTHVYHQFVVRARRRDALREYLRTRDIGTAVYYPEPLHIQPCFQALSPPPLPQAEAACQEALALPCFPGLSLEEQVQVVEAVADFYRR